SRRVCSSAQPGFSRVAVVRSARTEPTTATRLKPGCGEALALPAQPAFNRASALCVGGLVPRRPPVRLGEPSQAKTGRYRTWTEPRRLLQLLLELFAPAAAIDRGSKTQRYAGESSAPRCPGWSPATPRR